MSERARAMGSQAAGKVAAELAAGERVITLTSSEGEFRVSEAGARLSPYLARMIGNGENVVALLNIPTPALETVTKYCNKHAAAAVSAAANPSAAASSSSNAAPPRGDSELDKWDRELVGGLGMDALYDLLMAANFLGIEALIDTVSERVANEIKACKTPKEIREKFGITDDLTFHEKEEIRRENAWAFGPDDI